MADPAPYSVSYSFSGFQASNPATPLPAAQLDNELTSIQTSVGELVSAVEDVRRSDGALQNGVVTQDSLAQEIALMFDAGTTANATLLANAVAAAAASATSAAASAAAAEAVPSVDPAVLFAGAVLTDETVFSSVATVDIGAATTVRCRIDGTAAITSFGTVAKRLRIVRFNGALTLTHSATSLILLNGVSRTVTAGSIGTYMSDSSGNWRELSYSGVDAAGAVPIGGSILWFDDTLPTDGTWAWANGQVISNANVVCPVLLARWGSKFGGNGTSTMGVPNMQEVTPVGKSGMGGASAPGLLTSIATGVKGVINSIFGADTVTLTTPQIPSHSHPNVLNDGGHTHSDNDLPWLNGTGTGPQSGTGGGSAPGHLTILSGTTGITITNAAQGGGTAHNNLQPSIVCNYLLRIA